MTQPPNETEQERYYRTQNEAKEYASSAIGIAMRWVVMLSYSIATLIVLFIIIRLLARH